MTETLPAAAHRALGALNDLIEYCNDPGAEAFGARFELAQALSGHPRPADDPAPLRERIRRAICEADGFDFDQVEASDYQTHADAMLALLPAVPSAPADQTALLQRIAKAVQGVLPMSSSLACDVVADAVLSVLPATTDRAAEWRAAADHLETLDPIEAALAGQHAWREAAETLRRMADEAQQPAVVTTVERAAALGMTDTEYRAASHRAAVEAVRAAAKGMYAEVGLRVMDSLSEAPQPETQADDALRIRVLSEILGRLTGSQDGDSATDDVPAATVRKVLAEILTGMQPGKARQADTEGEQQ